MIDATVKDQILEVIDGLTPEQQLYALQLVRNLSRPKGKPSRSLLQFAGSIEPDDLVKMVKAIEDFEKVDSDEW